MKVAIVGATGYGGIELVRILRQHRRVEELSVYSSSYAGTSFGAFYPHIQDIYRGILKSVETKQLADDYDIVFVSAPPGVAAELMEGLLDGNARVIDLSGDFRIKDRSVYEAWYERNAAKQSFIQEAAYGSEWNREKIENARLIANPGCYPTAILNGLAPLVKENVLDMSSIIIDAKSGTTGAGKTPSAMTHFSEMNESLKIYKVNEHKHTPEIEQELSEWNAAAQPVTFTPHLVPMTRGIMATMYATCQSLSKEDILAIYEKYYNSKPFVRIRKDGFPSTKEVHSSNFNDISFSFDARTNRITVVSVIDNLMKGAAGQAVQNMNIMQKYEEGEGLFMLPVFP
ncbi:LOW QUALITY PROTEIN: N-acetyl-gamma-glutamyl-phosphate reductase [Geomicrobium sp. JCM 19039]|nr:LOW QUALITY PROTEIN: N-acetyl-gamma-glutamyl-phosphate reductase [Geomicrobium sp. JCM 19039]